MRLLFAGSGTLTRLPGPLAADLSAPSGLFSRVACLAALLVAPLWAKRARIYRTVVVWFYACVLAWPYGTLVRN